MSFRDKAVPIEGSEILEPQTLAVPLFAVPNSLNPNWYILSRLGRLLRGKNIDSRKPDLEQLLGLA